jgi:hypothetical protein
MQIVRSRAKDPGTYALDYVFGGLVYHKLIELSAEGYKFEDSELAFFRF